MRAMSRGGDGGGVRRGGGSLPKSPTEPESLFDIRTSDSIRISSVSATGLCNVRLMRRVPVGDIGVILEGRVGRLEDDKARGRNPGTRSMLLVEEEEEKELS